MQTAAYFDMPLFGSNYLYALRQDMKEQLGWRWQGKKRGHYAEVTLAQDHNGGWWCAYGWNIATIGGTYSGSIGSHSPLLYAARSKEKALRIGLKKLLQQIPEMPHTKACCATKEINQLHQETKAAMGAALLRWMKQEEAA